MNQERLMKVIVAPVISEKATLVGETRRQVVFEVLPDATKAEIKAAVELLFKEQKVEVAAVNVVAACRMRWSVEATVCSQLLNAAMVRAALRATPLVGLEARCDSMKVRTASSAAARPPWPKLTPSAMATT